MSLDAKMAGFGENFDTFLPFAKYFAVAKRLHFDIKANWKTVVVNFSEAYHIPICHPQLSKVLEQEMEELRAERRWTVNRIKRKTGFEGGELTPGSLYCAWQA